MIGDKFDFHIGRIGKEPSNCGQGDDRNSAKGCWWSEWVPDDGEEDVYGYMAMHMIGNDTLTWNT